MSAPLSVKHLKPNFHRFCTIHTQPDGTFLFKNVRDFTWTSEDRNQQQNWIDGVYNPDHIASVSVFNEPFGPGNIVAHSMISFHFIDGRTLCLSAEAQLKEHSEYSFLKAMFRGYRMMYIWGTEKDHVSLRTDLRKNTVYAYKAHISPEHMKHLFVTLIDETNRVSSRNERYALIANNCITSLWSVIHKHFSIPSWHWSLIFAKYIPNFLDRLGIIKLSEEEKLFGGKSS